jgi:transposase
MPPADEVMGAYRQVGTISGLAEHYQVPVHTIQGWARRLRKDGHSIGRTG